VLTDQQNNAIISLSTNIETKNELVKQQRTEVAADGKEISI
jgi:hypothetical protein